jgi:hypothetical protein
MGDAGHRIVAERFSMEAHVRRIEAIYDEELARAGALASPGGVSSPSAPSRQRLRGRAALEVPPA